MREISKMFQLTLHTDLLSKVPVDTGNMMAHTTMESVSQDVLTVTVAAPMNQRGGLRRKAGGTASHSKSKKDYARAVNYATKSPHRFWIEHRIQNTANIVRSNLKYKMY